MSRPATKLLRAIIMGAPGSGKGTISSRIVHDFGVKHISSGDLLRKQIQDKTANGMAAKRYIDVGELVPDNVMLTMILNELNHLQNHNWLLDGFPRTVEQAKALIRSQPIDIVINLRVPFEVIIDRIKGRWTHLPSGRIYHTEFNPPKKTGLDDVTGEPLVQRDDDKEETVKARLEHYRRLTHPVLQFFRNKGVVEEFSGNYSNELWPQVHDALAKVMTPLKYTHYE
ncbi:GTP:AMP phosphotransferase AK3, mitochondrial-like [Biomphalaria glabrata]|uniref:GTP:AMP phosphotransferase, mitochondrial n=2 Tax=Biomphalaria TaxID=6525 RepID=A0A9W3AFP6_BIOGL|nr:GTP:AMP phosphotransferase AK3, mitochondrial-like [Biomphalaria glabrata]XP_055885978.1 GTP:AMP phosphotransferase AK3, mitochondrial-like [Biomphalaria glabrata]XP_055885979.1 GTP:AMP phosphotransferase AK3, mitochondrial-like [Biomphalaria glabrata]XP_055885980.1 GTP:AMP phosphotransferase AK3, mitochondrial-like [Biomphalaria glabrata]XP_055885981.1 GTP:AMP phosphotransferase AK3, mitochondrial-like [Biomphalaria glabrata]KAK0069848.1 GTP:AMP phosphotransferase AK3 mitochondrial [Biomph